MLKDFIEENIVASINWKQTCPQALVSQSLVGQGFWVYKTWAQHVPTLCSPAALVWTSLGGEQTVGTACLHSLFTHNMISTSLWVTRKWKPTPAEHHTC